MLDSERVGSDRRHPDHIGMVLNEFVVGCQIARPGLCRQ